MRFSSLRHTLAALPFFDRDRMVADDAEALIRDFGPGALDAAETRSAREDLGLLPSRYPGHWNRVAREIGRRVGRATVHPLFDRAA